MRWNEKGISAWICGALIVLALLAAGSSLAQGKGLQRDVVVLFTSDVHCAVDQGFGYVGLKAVQHQLEREGCHVLLVDYGDAVQGRPLGLLTQGKAIIEIMNQAGYDVAIPGNHDFAYGMERFLSLTKAANFPYVCCNFTREGELVFPPYLIKEIDGVKLAFVGVTPPRPCTPAPRAPSRMKTAAISTALCRATTERIWQPRCRARWMMPGLKARIT